MPPQTRSARDRRRQKERIEGSEFRTPDRTRDILAAGSTHSIGQDPRVEQRKPSTFAHDISVIDAWFNRLRTAAIAERDELAMIRRGGGAATQFRGPDGELIAGGFEGQGGTMFRDPNPDFSPNAVIFTTLDGFDITWADILAEAQEVDPQTGKRAGWLTHPTTRQNFRFHNEMSLEALRELYRTHDAEYVGNQPQLPPGGGGGFGSGRGGGPSYVKADQLLVEELVSAYVGATTGKIHDDLIKKGMDIYNTKHKLGFDLRESQEVDPMAAVKEMVRKDKRYTENHTLRPESVDEREWIPQRQRALSAMGVAAGSEEDLGITLARMGAGGTGVRGAAESQIFADSNRLAQSQRDSLVKSASAALRLI